MAVGEVLTNGRRKRVGPASIGREQQGWPAVTVQLGKPPVAGVGCQIEHERSTDEEDVIGAWGPCPPPCPADVNHSGIVDVDDLLIVISHWGPCA